MEDVKVCRWVSDEGDPQNYESDCGGSFMINDETPEENGMDFCCFCGEKLKSEVVLLED